MGWLTEWRRRRVLQKHSIDGALWKRATKGLAFLPDSEKLRRLVVLFLAEKQFAQYQPFTPIIESLRGLLNGSPQTGDVIAAFAWCLGIAVVGYIWATSTFKKRA